MDDIKDFNINRVSFILHCDKLLSYHPTKNLVIESSASSIEIKTNNKEISFNNTTIFKSGHIMTDPDLSGIVTITCNTLNVNTVFLTNVTNTGITDNNSINFGYVRSTVIGYDPDIIDDKGKDSGRNKAYFTHINVSGGDSSFNNSLNIKKNLQIRGTTTISNDLIVNGTSFVTLNTSINNYILNIEDNLVSDKILTRDLSASNISISNELYVNNSSFLNDLNISGQMLNNVLKVPSTFTIDPSGHGNSSGTLIINGDLIVYGNKTIIESNIVEISDNSISIASNLLNKEDLSRNNAGLDISNVASLKYTGTAWTLSGGNLLVENKTVSLDVSLIDLSGYMDLSISLVSPNFDPSYRQLKRNMDDSYNTIYTRGQITNSFVLKSIFDISIRDLKTYVDNSYVSNIQYSLSFDALQTYLDGSYILKSTVSNPNIIDSSLIFLSGRLDSSYVLNSTFDGSYNKLKEQIEISFTSIRLPSLDSSTISVETINTRHYSQKFNNILWNQIGQDIGV